MPVVTVHMEKGRPVEMKRALSEAVTTAVAGILDVPLDWVTIIIDEVERENWAVGGQLQLDRFRPG
jgi:4-oxalocrotonate tautomerase